MVAWVFYDRGDRRLARAERTPDIVDNYFDALGPVFGLIKDCEEGRDVVDLLEGPVCHDGFKRLNCDPGFIPVESLHNCKQHSLAARQHMG